MPTLRFEGFSDDTFGEYLHTKDDYDNCASGKPISWLVGTADAKEMMVVVGQYAAGHCAGWMVGVSPAEFPDGDDHPIPEWPMKIVRGESPYSSALIVEAPDGVVVRCLERDADD